MYIYDQKNRTDMIIDSWKKHYIVEGLGEGGSFLSLD